MKLGAAISMALLVVALIGLQPLVAADSAPEMETCTRVMLALSPCLPYIDKAASNRSSSPSPTCCQPFRDLASSHVSGNRSKTCLCYLIESPTLLRVRLDAERIVSLIDICNVNDMGTKKIEPNAYLHALCEGSQTLDKKKVAFISALVAFLMSSFMAIYTILYRTIVLPKSPYFTIANMVNFGLATWYGIITTNRESSKISILNGIRAVLELAKIVSTIYRHRRLRTLTTFIAAETCCSVFICATVFSIFDMFLHGETEEHFFAYVSACFSSIMLIVPLFTLGEEVRVQPKKWFAFINAVVETFACFLWMLNGAWMDDIPTFVTGFIGLMTNTLAAFRLLHLQMQELELDERTRKLELEERMQELELKELERDRQGLKRTDSGNRLERQFLEWLMHLRNFPLL